MSGIARIAALIGGAVVVLVGLSLRWYTGSLAGIDLEGVRSGWDWLGLLDLWLALVVLAALALAVAQRFAVAVPTGARLGVLAAAAWGLFCVAYRVFSPPGDGRPGFVLEVDPSVGPFVTALGLIVLLAASRAPDRAARRRSSS